ncbi:hypothetical protein PHLCEN_2v3595 [Hermanssonia centrifuga]|uniref:Uncharacterized protein n=1 Tax=Hermanssonia centrifuga TaxID=98765 RepID=A0A2R6QER5_9APHY|nr:hypothetical protein PHLCEN_2v3595 [Hermanssonia centrifuga]
MHSVLLAINITNVILNTVPSLRDVSPAFTIIEVLTPILISRFLLNLRQLGEPENESQSRFNSRVSIPGFRVPTLESIVGNMGADLDHGPAEDSEPEVDEVAEDVDIDGGDVEVAVLDVASEDGSGGFINEI